MANKDVTLKFSLIDGVSKGLGAIEKKTASLSASLFKIGPAAVAAAAAVATIGVGAAFAEGIKTAASFEVALDKIGAKAGVSGDALTALGTDIRAISQDATKTGEEGAAAFERLASEGLSAKQAIEQLPTVLDFATAAAQGTAEAAGGLADTLDQFNLPAENMARAADTIAAGALAAGTGITQLQAALGAVGPTATAVGVSLEETTALLGVLAQNGIEAGKSGKALATIFDQLRDPFSKFREELAKIGITSTDFNVVLAGLEKAGPKAAGALNALGVQGTAALNILAKDGGAAVKSLTDQLGNVEGATSKAAASINDNLSGAFTRLKGAIDDAAIAFLQPILAPLTQELETLRDAINAFVASPEFTQLRDEFAQTFGDATEAVKAFIAEFDFTEAVSSVQDFIKTTGDGLKEFKGVVDEVAAAVGVAVDGISAAFNTIQVATAAAVTGSARLFENVTGFFGNFSDAAADASSKIKDFADVADAELNTQVAQLAGNLESLADNFSQATNATATATEENQKAIPVLQAISDEELRAANNARILAEAEQEHAAASDQVARSADAAGTAIGRMGDAAEGAATAVSESSKKAQATFKAEQDRIQENIDANKQLASSYQDVGASAEEAAGAAQEAWSQLDEDLGSAVIRGLTEGFGRVARDLAALRGVSEDVIRGELNNAIKGVTNSMVGLNEAIQRGDAEIEKLGGSAALERLRKGLEAAGEAARSARDEIAAMNEALQSEADSRDGDAAARENAAFREQLARIDELERKSGGTDRAAFDRARALAKKNHEARLAEIAKEARARVDAELGADEEIADARAGGGRGATGAIGPSRQPASTRPGAPAAPERPVNITINAPEFGGDINLDALARKLAPAFKRAGLL